MRNYLKALWSKIGSSINFGSERSGPKDECIPDLNIDKTHQKIGAHNSTTCC